MMTRLDGCLQITLIIFSSKEDMMEMLKNDGSKLMDYFGEIRAWTPGIYANLEGFGWNALAFLYMLGTMAI